MNPPKERVRRETEADLAGLVSAIAGRDQAAFAAFYDLTNRPVFAVALRVLGDHGLAEEVVHDVYLQIWNQAGAYRADRGTPFAWLMMIARSRSIDRIRSAQHLKRESETLDTVYDFAAAGEDPEEASLFAERRRQVREALRALSPEQREVIEIAYFRGFSQTEIAAHLGLPLGTVKTRMRVGLMRLRNLLAEN